MAAEEPTLTLSVESESGTLYLSGTKCVLSWTLDHKANGGDFEYWAKTNKRNLGLDLLQGDGEDPEVFTFLQRITNTNPFWVVFYPGTYLSQEDNGGTLTLGFTLPQGLVAGNYKLRVGDYKGNDDTDGLGGNAKVKLIRGTTDAFEVEADKILTITAPDTDSEWTQGTQQDVTWTEGDGWDAGDTVDIYYRKEVSANFITDEGYLVDLKNYPWTKINDTPIDSSDETYAWNISPKFLPVIIRLAYYRQGPTKII